MNDNTILINQTLHGYDNGHTLIASSTEIDLEVKRIMLPISDMSGNSMQEGFEEYITGYPLKGINCYALAKTWYAAEMKRPGCVWTHTLLINFSDISNLNNISRVLSFFKRPAAILESEHYQKPLIWHLNSIDDLALHENFNHFSREFIKVLITKLYASSSVSILIKSGSGKIFERLFLSIWLQQWPRLQRNFSFCNGSISPRNLNGKFLDLQVVPRKFENTDYKQVDLEILDSAVEVIVDSEAWSTECLKDLFYPSEFRIFSKNYGADVAGNRKSYKSLLNAFLFIKNADHTLREYIVYFATLFPNSKEAIILKGSLLNSPSDTKKRLLPGFSEREIIFELSISTFCTAYDYERLNYKARFLDYFFVHDPKGDNLLNEILKQGPNSFAIDAISSLSEEIEYRGREIPNWLKQNVLSMFINLNPRLTYNINFWKENLDSEMEIINSLKKNVFQKNIDWRTVIRNLIELGSSIDLDIFNDAKQPIRSYILDWINEHGDSQIGINWVNYLLSERKEVLEWLNINRIPKLSAASLIVENLNPNSILVVNHGIEVWMDMLSYSYNGYPKNFQRDLNAFALALAFNITNENARQVILKTFENVYHSLEDNKLPYNSWTHLEVHTRPLSFWKDWDKCKKLVIAIIEKTLKSHWSLKEMLDSIQDYELANRIVHHYNKRF